MRILKVDQYADHAYTGDRVAEASIRVRILKDLILPACFRDPGVAEASIRVRILKVTYPTMQHRVTRVAEATIRVRILKVFTGVAGCSLMTGLQRQRSE